MQHCEYGSIVQNVQCGYNGFTFTTEPSVVWPDSRGGCVPECAGRQTHGCCTLTTSARWPPPPPPLAHRPAPAVSHPSQTSGEGTEGGRRWHQHWAGRWFTGVGQGGHWPVWPGESLLPSGDKSWSVSRVQHRDNTLTECYHIPQVTHDSPPLGGHWEHWEHTLTA